MNTYHYVLYVHLLSLFIGIGAGSVILVCLFQLRAARTLEQAAPWGMMAGKTGKFFPIAILGLLATGAYMTHKFWTWSTPWIDVALAALVVLFAQGAGIAERAGHSSQLRCRRTGQGRSVRSAGGWLSVPASGWSSSRTSASSWGSSGT